VPESGLDCLTYALTVLYVTEIACETGGVAASEAGCVV
jgi:hypothetical protein